MGSVIEARDARPRGLDLARRSEAAPAERKLTVPERYQVWLRQTAYDYLDSLGVAERQRLLVWIEHLGQQPSRKGDFTERGSDRRDWQVAVVAANAIVWWVDEAVCEIKVVAIRSADA